MYYNIKRDTWCKGPSLNVPRHQHSTVVCGDKIYTFGGVNCTTPKDEIKDGMVYPLQSVTSIERLNAGRLLRGRNAAKWKLIKRPLGRQELKSGVAGLINHDEIITFGGVNSVDRLCQYEYEGDGTTLFMNMKKRRFKELYVAKLLLKTTTQHGN